jgi:phthalate 4,5-dioxygenase oxygenase subunit
MVTQEQNAILTRTGPETPMGNLMRRYWLPALLSSELLEPDSPPVRVKLLGEDLVAFRDTQGRIGLLDEYCAHRCVSLFLGRTEEGGLRCVFHGWKYDVTGQLVEAPNEPGNPGLVGRVKVRSYPVVEQGGVIWAYMGDSVHTPPAPNFAWTRVEASRRHVTKTWQECNWLQAMEGGLDTSHAPILHGLLDPTSKRPGIAPSSAFAQGKPPTLEIDHTDYGYQYAGIRELPEGRSMVRAYHWVMPFTQIRPQHQLPTTGGEGHGSGCIAGHMWVPMDDENCMVYNWIYKHDERDGPMTNEQRDAEDVIVGTAPGELLPNFRKVRNRDNDWLIDRQVQKYETFTGIQGVNTQDHALQESMGPIVDRTRENLGPADKAIITARRLLLRVVRDLEQVGYEPPGVAASYYNLQAIERILPAASDWRAELRDELHSTVSAPGVSEL